MAEQAPKVAPSQVPTKTLNTRSATAPNNTIPVIGYGTYQLTGDECVKGLSHALTVGYRHIDTASIYKNESEIAQVLKKFAKDIPREHLFITSKVSPYEQGAEKSVAAVQGIMKRLDVDYLDLVLIHWPGVSRQEPTSEQNRSTRLETYNSLVQLQAQGVIRHIGVSNFLVSHLQHLEENFPDALPAVNQFEVHPFCINDELISHCAKKGIVVEAYSPLARNEPVLMQNETMLQIANAHGKTVAQTALRWSLDRGFVTLPKSKTPAYIEQNFNIFDFQLSEDEIKRISALNTGLHTCWNPEKIV